MSSETFFEKCESEKKTNKKNYAVGKKKETLEDENNNYIYKDVKENIATKTCKNEVALYKRIKLQSINSSSCIVKVF